MSITSRLTLAGALALIPAASCLAAPRVDCTIPHSAFNASFIDALNEQCDEWNAGLEQGMTLWMPDDPKPASAAAVQARRRALNYCIAQLVKQHVPKQNAVLECTDGLN